MKIRKMITVLLAFATILSFASIAMATEVSTNYNVTGTITSMYVVPGTILSRGTSFWDYHTNNNSTCNVTAHGFSAVNGTIMVASQRVSTTGNATTVPVDISPGELKIQMRIHATNGTITKMTGIYHAQY